MHQNWCIASKRSWCVVILVVIVYRHTVMSVYSHVHDYTPTIFVMLYWCKIMYMTIHLQYLWYYIGVKSCTWLYTKRHTWVYTKTHTPAHIPTGTNALMRVSEHKHSHEHARDHTHLHTLVHLHITHTHDTYTYIHPIHTHNRCAHT